MLLYFDRDGLSNFRCHQNQQHQFFIDDDRNMMPNITQNLAIRVSEIYRICKKGINDVSEIS